MSKFLMNISVRGTFAVLFAYEFVLTLDSEVTLFWMGHHPSGATILFLLNRYISLGSQIIIVAGAVLEALQYLPWAGKTYALCSDPYRWFVSSSVFALSSVPIVTNMWGNLHGLSVVNDPSLGIIPIDPISASTVTKSLLVLSILQMAFTMTGRANDGATPTGVILLLEEPLTSILTSRFLIDLQNAQRKLAGSSRSVSLGEVAFQPQISGNTSHFIGSLGAQLSFHQVDEGYNEAEDAS
ncbi:hypothetical protein BD310DRAFT_949343 [Dichomitus squalens]|uniref:DUF6533 domain-containing protein n=2 Tax=Dichomitus squalens TaxID=114155 RepID=A0A4Q9PSQ8_9APHY|nr:hypothetical protein BD310DRAFT_949343 [Dichomitus squalens]